MTTATPRIGPWAALGLLIAAFIVLEIVLPFARVAATPLFPPDTHGAVALRAVSSIVLVWSLFAVVCILLRLRGQSLRDIGWMRPTRAWGWVLAVVFAALYGGGVVSNMIRVGAPVTTDWSLWRIAIALGIGISAGICEETVFRGFLMTQARDGGAHWVVQLLLSALLFGLAHIGWGSLSGHVQINQMVGAASATAILGLMMAGTYLAGGRSLTPAILAHGVIDLLVEPWLLLYAVTGGHF